MTDEDREALIEALYEAEGYAHDAGAWDLADECRGLANELAITIGKREPWVVPPWYAHLFEDE